MPTKKKVSDNPALQAIRNQRGMAGKIAEKIGRTRTAVWMWKSVPPVHAVIVARMLKMPVHMVCPEVFPPTRATRGDRKTQPGSETLTDKHS